MGDLRFRWAAVPSAKRREKTAEERSATLAVHSLLFAAESSAGHPMAGHSTPLRSWGMTAMPRLRWRSAGYGEGKSSLPSRSWFVTSPALAKHLDVIGSMPD